MNATFLFPHKNKNDVEDEVWWKSNFVQHHPISCSIVQHVGQTIATCWIQQCLMVLHQQVGSVTKPQDFRAANSIGRSIVSRLTMVADNFMQ